MEFKNSNKRKHQNYSRISDLDKNNIERHSDSKCPRKEGHAATASAESANMEISSRNEIGWRYRIEWHHPDRQTIVIFRLKNLSYDELLEKINADIGTIYDGQLYFITKSNPRQQTIIRNDDDLEELYRQTILPNAMQILGRHWPLKIIKFICCRDEQIKIDGGTFGAEAFASSSTGKMEMFDKNKSAKQQLEVLSNSSSYEKFNIMRDGNGKIPAEWEHFLFLLQNGTKPGDLSVAVKCRNFAQFEIRFGPFWTGQTCVYNNANFAMNLTINWETQFMQWIEGRSLASKEDKQKLLMTAGMMPALQSQMMTMTDSVAADEFVRINCCRNIRCAHFMQMTDNRKNASKVLFIEQKVCDLSPIRLENAQQILISFTDGNLASLVDFAKHPEESNILAVADKGFTRFYHFDGIILEKLSSEENQLIIQENESDYEIGDEINDFDDFEAFNDYCDDKDDKCLQAEYKFDGYRNIGDDYMDVDNEYEFIEQNDQAVPENFNDTIMTIPNRSTDLHVLLFENCLINMRTQGNAGLVAPRAHIIEWIGPAGLKCDDDECNFAWLEPTICWNALVIVRSSKNNQWRPGPKFNVETIFALLRSEYIFTTGGFDLCKYRGNIRCTFQNAKFVQYIPTFHLTCEAVASNIFNEISLDLLCLPGRSVCIDLELIKALPEAADEEQKAGNKRRNNGEKIRRKQHISAMQFVTLLFKEFIDEEKWDDAKNYLVLLKCPSNEWLPTFPLQAMNGNDEIFRVMPLVEENTTLMNSLEITGNIGETSSSSSATNAISNPKILWIERCYLDTKRYCIDSNPSSLATVLIQMANYNNDFRGAIKCKLQIETNIVAVKTLDESTNPTNSAVIQIANFNNNFRKSQDCSINEKANRIEMGSQENEEEE